MLTTTVNEISGTLAYRPLSHLKRKHKSLTDSRYFIGRLASTMGIKSMKTTRIAILLFDGIKPSDAVGPYEILSKIPESKVFFVSLEPGEIICNDGSKINSDYSVTDISEFDMLIIPGSQCINNLINKLAIQC